MTMHKRGISEYLRWRGEHDRRLAAAVFEFQCHETGHRDGEIEFAENLFEIGEAAGEQIDRDDVAVARLREGYRQSFCRQRCSKEDSDRAGEPAGGSEVGLGTDPASMNRPQAVITDD